MAIYGVYVPVKLAPRSTEAVELAVLVREKFSFFAFILPLVWLLWHRAWLALLLFIIVTAGISIGMTQVLGFSGESVAALDLVVALYVGMSAPDILARALQGRGFALANVVIADNEDEALRRFADHWFEDKITPNMARSERVITAPPPSGPIIGLFPEAGR